MARTDNVIRIGGEFDSIVSQIKNEINRQRDYITQIKGSMDYLQDIWDSPAQRKFSQRFDSDRKEMDEYCELLLRYLNEITKLKDSYTNADTVLQSRINSI